MVKKRFGQNPALAFVQSVVGEGGDWEGGCEDEKAIASQRTGVCSANPFDGGKGRGGEGEPWSGERHGVGGGVEKTEGKRPLLGVDCARLGKEGEVL